MISCSCMWKASSTVGGSALNSAYNSHHIVASLSVHEGRLGVHVTYKAKSGAIRCARQAGVFECTCVLCFAWLDMMQRSLCSVNNLPACTVEIQPLIKVGTPFRYRYLSIASETGTLWRKEDSGSQVSSFSVNPSQLTKNSRVKREPDLTSLCFRMSLTIQ